MPQVASRGNRPASHKFCSAGARDVPVSVDLNSGPDAQGMYESADIVKYLFETYGEGAEMPPYLLEKHTADGVDADAAAGRTRHVKV